MKVEEIFKTSLEHCTNDVTLIYVQYMRFMRRTKGITASRDIFKKGREDTRCDFTLFVAAANLEYYCTKVLQ